MYLSFFFVNDSHGVIDGKLKLTWSLFALLESDYFAVIANVTKKSFHIWSKAQF